MRTTMTLDPDVAEQLALQQQASQLTYKQLVNQALRLGLSSMAAARTGSKPFKVRPLKLRYQPGVDEDRLQVLADQMQTEMLIEKLSK
jgi:hypothetical protein